MFWGSFGFKVGWVGLRILVLWFIIYVIEGEF